MASTVPMFTKAYGFGGPSRSQVCPGFWVGGIRGYDTSSGIRLPVLPPLVEPAIIKHVKATLPDAPAS